MKTAIAILGIIVLILAGSTYHLYGNRNELASQISTLEQEKDAITAKLEERIEDISREKEEEIARVSKVCDVLVRDMKEEVEQGQVKITQLADRLSVVMVDKVLFPSGDAEITPDGLDVLERVGKALKDTQDRIIRVEGHTDNLPIMRRLKERFPTKEEYLKLKGCYVLNRKTLKLMKEKSVVMHPLPRVDEISPEVDTDPRAAYFRQAENGLYVRMALLNMILGGKK